MLKKRYKHLTYNERIVIEKMLKIGEPISNISKALGVHLSTIYREIKKGKCIILNCDYSKKEIYSADISHNRYIVNLKAKGVDIKLGNDHKFANFLEEKLKNGFSPEACLMLIKKQNLNFKTSVCFKTIYNYIDKDVFLSVSNKDLIVKRNKKRKYQKVTKNRMHKKLFGMSIEQRNIDRSEFGHWEIDTVIPKRNIADCLLVLTERKTRYEMIFKLKSKTTEEVNKHLKKLKKKYNSSFNLIFKTITSDNGSEFNKLSKVHNKVYYCHPYSSWERGSNENNNRFIRRFIPKGKDIRSYPDNFILYIEDFINDYPRKILNNHSSKELFDIEMSKILDKQ